MLIYSALRISKNKHILIAINIERVLLNFLAVIYLDAKKTLKTC